MRPVCRQPGSVRVRHRTLFGASGGVSPVTFFAELSEFKSGEHRTQLGASGGVRPVTCTFCRPLCVLVWCAPDASGANLGASGALQVTVRL